MLSAHFDKLADMFAKWMGRVDPKMPQASLVCKKTKLRITNLRSKGASVG
jgi:hypothetical protein